MATANIHGAKEVETSDGEDWKLQAAQPLPIALASAPVKPSGRPGGKGKKRDPHFRQVTAYIPRQLHTHATVALRLANQIRVNADSVNADKEDFSELLTRLLADWFEHQTFYRPGR